MLSLGLRHGLAHNYHECCSHIFSLYLLMQATVIVEWSGWSDALSGLHHYELTVYDMQYILDDGGLRNDVLVFNPPPTFNVTDTEVTS